MTEQLVETTRIRMQRSEGQLGKFRSLVHERARALSFTEIEAKHAQDSIDAVLWKFTLSGIHLERLWMFRESLDLQKVLDSSFGKHSMTSHEEIAAALELEGFLFQGRAMLDFLMHHVLAACRVGFQGQMSRRNFRKVIHRVGDTNSDKANAAMQYLDLYVFPDDKWGGFIRSLRNRIAHRDRLRPGRESQEKAIDTALDWPTIRGSTFHRLTQDFENEAWEALTTMIPALWDRTWIGGPERSGMWESA